MRVHIVGIMKTTPFTAESFRVWLRTETNNLPLVDALSVLDKWTYLQTKFYVTFGVAYRELKANFDLRYLFLDGRNDILADMAVKAINRI